MRTTLHGLSWDLMYQTSFDCEVVFFIELAMCFIRKAIPFLVLGPSEPLAYRELCQLPCSAFPNPDLFESVRFFQHSLSLWTFLPQY